MQKQQGFTLVELVIVIVILGILAVTAAPKFLNLAGDAKAGTLEAVKASLQSANSVIYSKAILQNKQNDASDTVTESTASGGTVAVVYGYVAATAEAVNAVLDTDENFVAGKVAADVTDVAKTTDVVIYPKDKALPTSATDACVLVYTPATSTTKPQYTVVSGGC